MKSAAGTLERFASQVAKETGLPIGRVTAVLALLDGGATIPFIARYRKEATGSMDEIRISEIRRRNDQLTALEARKEVVLHSISEQGMLTGELSEKIRNCNDLSELEDLYLPFRPKRKTRAGIAREKGLEPFAAEIMAQKPLDIRRLAKKYVNPEKQVGDEDAAIDGARDIIAEWASENPGIRKRIRKIFANTSVIRTKVVKGKEADGEKFRDYFEWEEGLSHAPSHRILAMFRAMNEGIVSMKIEADEGECQFVLRGKFVKNNSTSAVEVEKAIRDGWKRLLAPAMETEMKSIAKQKADEEAIRVFSANLRELLMAAPLGQKNVLAVDPGFRTGCKLACLNRQGKLIHSETIYPHPPSSQANRAKLILEKIVKEFQVEAIAIGNGTAGRETESFLRSIGFPSTILLLMVNESGASVYSASEVAREEFPDQDITVRGAVSIGRRLMDPLAELVKIDPRSIGVGQYQHDVPQNQLKESLDETVERCVNSVGVEVNTASKELLTYVSGLGPQLAGQIVKYRNENGPFRSRATLKEVPRLGEKAFEQCAGFLRIADAPNPLDRSAVHPESYAVVSKMATDLKCSVGDLLRDETLRKQINPDRYVTDETGLPTLMDILAELARPGRDPREKFENFAFAEGVREIADLKSGMVLPGIVTNVTKFGAFVDIGVHQDGLIHVSEIADKFVKDPSEVVKVQQKVKVRVIGVDADRKRISLSLKAAK